MQELAKLLTGGGKKKKKRKFSPPKFFRIDRVPKAFEKEVEEKIDSINEGYRNILQNLVNRDIVHLEDEVKIVFEVPGLKKEGVGVEAEEKPNELKISLTANWNEENVVDEMTDFFEDEDGTKFRNGEVEENVYLNNDSLGDIEDVEAKLENGIMTVSVPKKDNAQEEEKGSYSIF